MCRYEAVAPAEDGECWRRTSTGARGHCPHASWLSWALHPPRLLLLQTTGQGLRCGDWQQVGRGGPVSSPSPNICEEKTQLWRKWLPAKDRLKASFSYCSAPPGSKSHC